jgi:GNAT superfamily N-acetyltransferase
MNIYFIGGASGSGKSAIIPELKELWSNQMAVHDFDDIGVPDGADKQWRQESTEKWLQQLLSQNKDACLLGQMVLGEILSCPSAVHIEKINFCLLDVSDFKRIERLKQRNTYGADQNMLNWSAWLRMHHQDPKWTPHVIQDDCAHIMDFSRLAQLQNWQDVANVHILDTTSLDINQVAHKVVDWANSISTKPFSIIKSQPSDAEYVDDQIVAFNQKAVSFDKESAFVWLNYCIKNDEGKVIASINAFRYWRIVYVDVLFVGEKYRNKGFGGQLLSHVENEAKKQDATLVHLDTFDFQAKDFYLKHGYEIFGILENCPTGHKKFYMKKELIGL